MRDSAWEMLGEVPEDRKSAATLLARFIRVYLETLLSGEGDQACGSLLLWEAVRPSEAIDAVVHDYVEPAHRALVAVVRRLLPADEADHAPLHARSVLGQILHYRVFRPFIDRLATRPDGGGLDAAEAAAHVTRTALRAMRCSERFIEGALARAAVPEGQHAR
jgi:hypothetical protein